MPVDHPEIPQETLANWQQLVDLVAELADVPASLIMKTDAPDHAVLITSDHPENPYPVGLSFQLNPKLYCQGVLQRDGELVVEDAACDPDWADNDDLEHGMTFYIGLPLKWPDGSVFGTICVLDRKQNRRALLFREGLAQFARMVESDLALLQEVYLRRALEEKLNETLAQLETVSRIAPVNCRKPTRRFASCCPVWMTNAKAAITKLSNRCAAGFCPIWKKFECSFPGTKRSMSILSWPRRT